MGPKGRQRFSAAEQECKIIQISASSIPHKAGLENTVCAGPATVQATEQRWIEKRHEGKLGMLATATCTLHSVKTKILCKLTWSSTASHTQAHRTEKPVSPRWSSTEMQRTQTRTKWEDITRSPYHSAMVRQL